MSRYVVERVVAWTIIAAGLALLPVKVGTVVVVAAAVFLWYTREERP